MIVFKTFLKVLSKYRVPIIMYTIFLIVFGGFNVQTNETNNVFEASKSDILIINNDENVGITKNLVNYIKDNSNTIKIKNDEDAINDALFYRDVNYVIYIPKNYRKDFLKGLNPTIEVKSTGDYQSSYSKLLLERYIKVAQIYQKSLTDEAEIIKNINQTLSKQTKTEITSKIDTNKINKATFYFNFLSYSMLAGAIYVICLVMSSFNEEKISKRINISSTNYRRHNFFLLLANSLFIFVMWLAYMVLGIILCGNIMITSQGLIYLINSLVFTFCCLTIGFLISNLVNNKNALNGIINVVALGSSFLCGAFVPVEWLPKSVLTVAHVLPSYWYIQSNELLKTIEEINIETIKPIIINMLVVILFGLLFIIAANVVRRIKRKK